VSAWSRIFLPSPYALDWECLCPLRRLMQLARFQSRHVRSLGPVVRPEVPLRFQRRLTRSGQEFSPRFALTMGSQKPPLYAGVGRALELPRE